MKKILLTILIMISSFLSFSQNNNKKDVGIKAMFHIGYDRFFAVKHINLLSELEAYKKFELKNINTIINVGGGIDFSTYIWKEYDINVRPYFMTEVGGIVAKDIKMFASLKLGVGFVHYPKYPKYTNISTKARLSLGMTYKDHVTFEIGYNNPSTFTVGIGSRFEF